MASSIDPTKPASGNATTASVRSNFSTAKTEIEALQSDVSAVEDKTQNLDASGNYSGGTISSLAAALAVASGGTGATTASGARTNLGITKDNLGITTGQVSLEVSGTTTVVSEAAVTAASKIFLSPRNADAASVDGDGVYASSVSAGTSFTLTHGEYSGTRTYDYLVID